jgi:hypothetical protein
MYNLYGRSICGHPFSRPLLAAPQYYQTDQISYYMGGEGMNRHLFDAPVMLVHSSGLGMNGHTSCLMVSMLGQRARMGLVLQ